MQGLYLNAWEAESNQTQTGDASPPASSTAHFHLTATFGTCWKGKFGEPTDTKTLEVFSKANVCFYKGEQNSSNTFRGRKHKAGRSQERATQAGNRKAKENQLPQPIVKD